MKKTKLNLWCMSLSFFVFSIGTPCFSQTSTPKPSVNNIKAPYYFIAIHSEPDTNQFMASVKPESVKILKQMIEKADNYNIKLTIMLSAADTKYLTADDIAKWKSKGHEIAAHHHGIYHGFWDSYTNFSPDDVNSTRTEKLCNGVTPCNSIEPYLGTLDSYMDKIYSLDYYVKAGCMNDEFNKGEMPNEIIYDTCSGYSNQNSKIGKTGTDGTPEKGINEFIMSASVNGIERKWLGHSQLMDSSQLNNVLKKFGSLKTNIVYGTVNHASDLELPNFNTYIDMIHKVDPSGLKSKTLSEAIEGKLIPVKKVNIPMEEPQPNQNNCDFNKDGKIDQFESSQCGGNNGATPPNQNNCDFNKDGKIDQFESSQCGGNNGVTPPNQNNCDFNKDGKIDQFESMHCGRPVRPVEPPPAGLPR